MPAFKEKIGVLPSWNSFYATLIRLDLQTAENLRKCARNTQNCTSDCGKSCIRAKLWTSG